MGIMSGELRVCVMELSPFEGAGAGVGAGAGAEAFSITSIMVKYNRLIDIEMQQIKDVAIRTCECYSLDPFQFPKILLSKLIIKVVFVISIRSFRKKQQCMRAYSNQITRTQKHTEKSHTFSLYRILWRSATFRSSRRSWTILSALWSPKLSAWVVAKHEIVVLREFCSRSSKQKRHSLW